MAAEKPGTVLIIGGTGQIGMQVTKQEIAAGKDVQVFGRSLPSSEKLDFIHDSDNGYYTQVDVSGDQEKLAKLIKQVNPAKIYFMAEPFPMKDADVEKAVTQMNNFYRTLHDIGFKGPIVVIGTAGIEQSGEGFPLTAFSVENEKIVGQIPYFKARRYMAQISAHAVKQGLDVRRVALPWVVSGDAHHADFEPLPNFVKGSMGGFSMPSKPMDVISGQESARAIRFVADKGKKGWTYQASGVPLVQMSEVIQAELSEIGGGRLRSTAATFDSLMSQAGLFLNFIKMKKAIEKNPFLIGMNALWEVSARVQFNLKAGLAVNEAQMHAATASALSAVLPTQADMTELAKLGFKPTDPATQRKQVFEEARKLARLLLKEGIVKKPSPPSGPSF